MIGYVILGSNDIKKSAEFYDGILSILGAKRVFDDESHVAWATNNEAPILCVATPYDGNEASVGNGTMIALQAASPEEVDRLHAMALSLGAKNEGDPGERSGGYYCAYFRDLDGNKLNFHAKPNE